MVESASLQELSGKIRGGEIRSEEVMASAYDRIEAHDSDLNVFRSRLDRETALKKAREIVSEMSKNGPLGIMMSKQAINRGLDQSRFNGFLGEGDLAHMLTFSEDRAAGLQAFKERRRADFKGQ